MRKRIKILIALLLLPVMLSGCVVVPLWDDGYYGGYHRGGGHHGGHGHRGHR